MKITAHNVLAMFLGILIGALGFGVVTENVTAKTPVEDLMTIDECYVEAKFVGATDGNYSWNPTSKLYERKGICRINYEGQMMSANEARRQWAAANLQGFGEE